jgi:hypothetical protein
VEEGAKRIRERKADVTEKRALEGSEALPGVRVLARLDLAIEVRMRPKRALCEGDQGPRQNIGTFNRDAYWHHLVGRLQIVGRSIADTTTTVEIHRVVDGAAHPLGRLVFHDGGDDRRLLATRDHGRRDGAAGLVDVGRLGHAHERLLQALHLGDRQSELLADPAIGRREPQHGLGAGCRGGRERYGAARRQAFHEHAPALTDHFVAADDPIHRNENV